MNSPFDNVKDSSVWFNPQSLKVVQNLDNKLYFGIVRKAFNDKNTNELRYLVEIRHKNDIVITNCRMVRSFGGAFNYEDIVLRGYDSDNASKNQNGIVAIAGDIVLVGQFGGRGEDGVILGSLTHPARKSFLDVKDGPAYKSEFNGIETSINKDGEWTLTFKGQPTNLDKLASAPSDAIPAPEYDKDVGTSFMKWDKTGSFTVSDEATDGDKIQKLFIDKKNGTFEIDSGKIKWILKKEDQSLKLTCKTVENTVETSITDKTKNYEVEATDHMHIKTPKFVVEGGKVRLGEEGASDWLILGSTYRKEDKKMNDKVGSKLQTAATKILAAGTAITAASAIPMVPGVPLAALAPAGAQLLQAAADILEASVAITLFEASGAANNYLSAVSKTK